MADKHINDELRDTKKVKLEDITSFSKGKNVSKNDVMEDGEHYCIRYGELYTLYNEKITTVYSKTDISDGLIRSRYGDVLIPSSGETAIDLATASTILQNDIIIGGDINILRPDISILNPLYLSYLLNSSQKHNIAKVAQGSSIIHVYNDQLKKLTFNIHSINTQERIANLLSSIDDLIQQSMELEQLYLSKREYYMQLIFSKDPKVRYLNFNDDLNSFPLSYFFEKQVNTIMVQDNEVYQQVTISNEGIVSSRKFVDGAKIGRKRQFKIDLNKYPNTLTFIRQGIYNGGIGFINDKSLDGAIVTENMPLLTLSDKLDEKFFSALLKSGYYRRDVLFDLKPTGSAQSAIHEKDWLKQRITIPSKSEQVRISKFFNLLDELIDDQKNITNEYKHVKQYHLNNIFK